MDDFVMPFDEKAGSETPKENGVAGSAQELDELFSKLKRWYLQDVSRVADWRKQAREDYRFYNGNHWTEEEKKTLEEELGKPALTFNRTAVLVNAVIGNEISNRREVNYFPREEGDAKANEVLTSAAEWFRDNCDAEDEESVAFEDTVKVGMGWTETRLDFDENPDGDSVIERIDPMEMVWDGAAQKANLLDATRIFRVREITLEQARIMFHGKDDKCLHAGWAAGEKGDNDSHQARPGFTYQGEGDTANAMDLVTLVEAQWYEYEPFYRAQIMDESGQPQLLEMEVERFNLLKKQVPQMRGIKQKRRKVMKAFLGSEILEAPAEGLCPTHFSYQCVTGYRDEETGGWYGVVRPTKDPQKWANKFLSQIIHILNVNAKGGLLAEENVFVDDKKAEKDWAKSNSIIRVRAGVLAGGRIQPKPSPQVPSGYFNLMEYAVNSIRDVTGINLEMIGMREATQSGVLEFQRREAGQIMLAKLFNGLRKYRKTQGRIMLYIIQNYLSDGRMVRILGKDKGQYAKLSRSDVADVKYDIIVDDAPSSPNEKERTWGILVQMLPIMKDYLSPEIALELLKYSPLPASLAEKLKGAYDEAQQAQAKNPEAQQQKQIEMAHAQATIKKTDAEGNLRQAQADKFQIEAQLAPQQAQAEALAALMQLSQPGRSPASMAP